MPISRLKLLFGLLTCAATSIFAGPIGFVASGVLENGSLLSGNVVIDTVLGTVTSANLTLTGPFAFTVGPNPVLLSSFYFEVANFDGASITVVLPIVSFVGYQGGAFRLTEPPTRYSTARLGKGGGISDFTSGALTQTPEPATATLLGATLLALIGLRRVATRK